MKAFYYFISQPSLAQEVVSETALSDASILERSLSAGPVVFMVLLSLIGLSVVSWAIVVGKWIHLKRVLNRNEQFMKKFWDSRSLNELNSSLADIPYSPLREVFKIGYSELLRGNQLRENVGSTDRAISVALDNLNRTLTKAKALEKKRLESYLSMLAITASAAPFIGLFGTVWGIMNAFEGIAQTGNTSLAAVAPGISEALIATAFGLAAAIPAVIGYNFSMQKIRGLVTGIDGFTADFLNLVERFFITDPKLKASAEQPQQPRI